MDRINERGSYRSARRAVRPAQTHVISYKNMKRKDSKRPFAANKMISERLAAVLKRRKAIRKKISSFQYTLTESSDSENSADSGQELDLVAVIMRERPTTVRLKVWSDGEAWLSVFRPRSRKKGGWDVNESFYFPVSDIKPRLFTEKLEETLAVSVTFRQPVELKERLMSIWTKPAGGG